MLPELRELYAYNRWANHRTLDAAAPLAPEEFARELGGSFPSVQATLLHMVGADWIWLQRWRGTSPQAPPPLPRDISLPKLRDEWDRIERERTEFLDQLSEDDLHARLTYRTLAGDPYESILWQVLRHVVNHSTYHRGQVATLLRQLGHRAAPTDLVLFYRELSPDRS